MVRRRGAEKRSLGALLGLAFLLVLGACSTATPTGAAPTRPGKRATADSRSRPDDSRDDERWVNATLAGLSLAEKAAQLVMVRAYGHPLHPDSDDYRRLAAEARDLGVGGIVAFDSDLDTLPLLLDRLQAEATVPLLVGADFERGVAFRIRRGGTDLPSAMALGAADSEPLAQAAGRISAQEARALGVHWLFAPVADVNIDPNNPVIGSRAFGEDPERVARMVAAFIRGARSEESPSDSALTTAKHFPGHGDTGVDSHLDLPVLDADRDRLERVELVPFRAAIEAGVDAIMLGHLAVPALDPSGTPASLSRPIATGLLREEMGFQGLIATDALEMRGLRAVWPGARAVDAILAGADVLLLPEDPALAIGALVRAVREGRISEDRIDASVRRVLRAKADLGLDHARRLGSQAVRAGVGRPDNASTAQEIAEASITVVRNRDDVLPLHAETRLGLLHLGLTSGVRIGLDIEVDDALLARGLPVTHFAAGPAVAEETALAVLEAATRASHVVVSAFVSTRTGLSNSQVRLIERLRDLGRPLIILALDSPYMLAQIPWADTYLCTYGIAGPSQEAAARVLLGEIPARGTLPVTLAKDAPAGHGIALEAHDMTLRAAPAPAGTFDAVDALLDRYLERGAFPGGVLAVGHRGALVHVRPFGRLSYDDNAAAVTADTIYDLASLTKVIATTTMAMMLDDEARIGLDMPLQAFLPDFVGAGKRAVTLRHLLTHSSGIDWWAPLYKELRGPEAYLERIEAMELAYETGTKTLYSDLGLIVLGAALERAAGMSLDAFAEKRIFAPLGMADTGYLPGPDRLDRIAPTEDDPWRGRVLRGEVHDENAFALGGIAPHAGLFSTAPDLARFAQMMLWGGVYDHQRLIAGETVDRFTRPAGVPDATRALGWDTKSPTRSSAGRWFSPSSFGHTGYTGTSLWIDPVRELFVVLLTNRVHPTRDNTMIREVRPAVADAVVEALGLAGVPAASNTVHVGLDRVAAGEISMLRGKRIGLVVHAASQTLDSRHAVDVLRGQGLEVVRLFSPEHGLRGRAAAGEKVGDGHDPGSGLPVISLYGKRRKPVPEDLAGLDTLVIDLQDAGVRFYTYASTLLLCLEAAAEQGIEVVVLDRPNPLGGERFAGPLSAPRNVVPASFVNQAPGPLVHGLTLGEMARLVNNRADRPARLRVVPMRGWHRWMTWADTGRPWTPPSPNLRTPNAALAYPGVALLEATNVSEGRGTPAPFLHLGAPWLGDDTLLDIDVPGFDLAPARFTPRASPAEPHPKHLDSECVGAEVVVSDPHATEPYRLGVTLLRALIDEPGFAWLGDGRALVRLMGTPQLLDALRSGKTVDQIIAMDRADHDAWRTQLRTVRLYR